MAVAATLLVVGPDLRLAHHYKQTLDQANGKEFESYALRDSQDAHVGTVFSYRTPSWVEITVDRGHARA